MRVAVIDSGVAFPHPHIQSVAGGLTISAEGCVSEGFADSLGHGTAVMAAIQEKAPDAEYFAVRVFERALRTSAYALTVAIEWCLANRIDAINMSLGTTNPEHESLFRGAVARLALEGVLLVAARACLPGSLPGVIGVEADPDCPRDCCIVREAVVRASGYPRPVPGVPPERNLQGVSFAVANVTGLVARAAASIPAGPNRLQQVLSALAHNAPAP
jgi:hypothetical protein